VPQHLFSKKKKKREMSRPKATTVPGAQGREKREGGSEKADIEPRNSKKGEGIRAGWGWGYKHFAGRSQGGGRGD